MSLSILDQNDKLCIPGHESFCEIENNFNTISSVPLYSRVDRAFAYRYLIECLCNKDNFLGLDKQTLEKSHKQAQELLFVANTRDIWNFCDIQDSTHRYKILKYRLESQLFVAKMLQRTVRVNELTQQINRVDRAYRKCLNRR